MGKIRRNRTKFHLSTKNSQIEESTNQEIGVPKDLLTIQLPPLSLNPFSGGQISTSSFDQKEHEEKKIDFTSDVASVNVQEKSAESNIHLNKKERRKLKRQKFLEKLEVTRVTKESKKAAKKRSEVPVVGDLKPMCLALSDITKIISSVEDSQTDAKIVSTKKKRKRKPKWLKEKLKNTDPLEGFKTINEKGIKKIQSKRTQKHMVCEIQRLQKLVSDKKFNGVNLILTDTNTKKAV
uniref:protein FAM207A-like n=1 Tax=Styela clava TaxID=7725 RepID=UPI00193ABE37|nr:protein FAM207A-like [Styela clava]